MAEYWDFTRRTGLLRPWQRESEPAGEDVPLSGRGDG